MFIDFEEEYNCTLVSIWENGPMTLRQIGERIGVSFARIKQIETKALKKMRKNRLLM
jgi:DNA-directed RNA polymerase sigma subunit (sigma70/sigma32)